MTRMPEAVRRMFGVAHNCATTFELTPAIFPGYVASVVRKAADGERKLVTMNWGFVLLQQNRGSPMCATTRSSPVCSGSSRSYSAAAWCRRAVTANRKGEKPATWHWFAVDGDEQRPLFVFAGIWMRYRGPLKKNCDSVTEREGRRRGSAQAHRNPLPPVSINIDSVRSRCTRHLWRCSSDFRISDVTWMVS